jgi:hypothetical protein
MRVGGQRHAAAALPPEITLYPLYGTVGGHEGRSGKAQKMSPPPRFDSQTVQSVMSRLSYV